MGDRSIWHNQNLELNKSIDTYDSKINIYHIERRDTLFSTKKIGDQPLITKEKMRTVVLDVRVKKRNCCAFL